MSVQSLLPPAARTLAEAIAEAGGRALLVGGCVRDLVLGIAPKDLDFEVYGLAPARLREVLARFGAVQEVGKRFGVFKLRMDGMDVDVALPRREKKTAPGHKGFAAEPDPFLSPERASSRRDFTINAMMLDPLSGELLDFHGGQRDLQNHVLRHVSPAFVEDPLRPLRGMQFAARFRLSVHPETARLARTMLAEYETLPSARIWEEWRKWAHAPYPDMGLEALKAMGWLLPYPELAALVGCPQEPQWHPEGDVWTHTKIACRRMHEVCAREGIGGAAREALMFAILAHDFGKPATTTRDEKGRIRSPGHAQKSAELAKSFLARIGAPKRLVSLVIPLVAEHLAHMHGKPTPRAVRRLAVRLAPATIALWARLVEADASARPPKPPADPAAPWLALARKLEAEAQKPRPIVQGRMLLALGVAPGPRMGEIIRRAYEAQLDGAFADEEEARKWLVAQGLVPKV